ncbi:hypothetical protein Bca4012_031896 [Brassica carinata]
MVSRRKTREPKEETVTLGPAVRDGEQVFGVVHIFASSNDTFIVSNQPLKADRDESSPYAAQDVAQRCKTNTPGPDAQSALRAHARSGMKVGRIGCNSNPNLQYSQKGWKKGKEALIWPLGLQGLQHMIPLRLRFNGIASQRIQEKMDYSGTCSIEIEM